MFIKGLIINNAGIANSVSAIKLGCFWRSSTVKLIRENNTGTIKKLAPFKYTAAALFMRSHKKMGATAKLATCSLVVFLR